MTNSTSLDDKKQPIVVVAAGTGGHVFPAIAFAQTCLEKGRSLVFITDERGLKYFTPYQKLFQDSLILTGSFYQKSKAAFAFLKKTNPIFIWGFGGRETILPLICARLLGVQTGIHQSDIILGRSNAFLSLFVHHIALGHKVTQNLPFWGRQKARFTGTPVRQEFGSVQPLTSLKEPLTLLVLGGSQGSRFWLDILPSAVALLSSNVRHSLKIIHQSDQDNPYIGDVEVQMVSFIQDMPTAIQQADFVFTRSGGSVVAELMLCGRPALFVPYPYATDQHQYHNAQYVVQHGGGWIEEQKNLTSLKLKFFLEDLVYHPEKILTAAENMRRLGVSQASENLLSFLP
jgi:UDP-N-acetylglucosamine--N-acetylmuramyl-(pentapeptide) pyrophosphoryl-undecaprenol N-acetylglucosamine transferase